MRHWCLVLLLCLPACAQSRFTLAEALFTMRTIYPAAEVTGRFADWRAPSMYRSHSGLHNGYDIAMPAGSGVPAVWPGVVVAVTPWTDTQVGISVQLAGGLEITYGHLIGMAKVGQVVRPGDILGLVAVDHVDMKMRDSAGGFVDFGQGAQLAVDPAEIALEKARVALQEVNEMKAQLASLNDQLVSLTRERAVLRKERTRLSRMVPQLNELVATGAMASADEGRLPLRLHFVETRLKELESRLPVVARQRSRMALELSVQQTYYEEQALEAARYGKALKPDEPAVLSSRSSAAPSKAGGRLEELLKYGVLSKKEYDDARRRQRWDAAAARSAVGGAPAGGQGQP